jgi:hypothetical protein
VRIDSFLGSGLVICNNDAGASLNSYITAATIDPILASGVKGVCSEDMNNMQNQRGMQFSFRGFNRVVVFIFADVWHLIILSKLNETNAFQ